MMREQTKRVFRIVIVAGYFYLALPMILFCLGWCKWYIGIPVAVIVAGGMVLCIKEHWNRPLKLELMFRKQDAWKVVGIVVLIMMWVALSGVGGLMWQNSDHWWRNEIYELLVTEKWPVTATFTTDTGTDGRGMVYYIGFWLPAAAIGKFFGIAAGYVAQYVWAVFGICVFYALICLWRKKVMVWPLFVIVFFSGLDVVGALISQSWDIHIFSDLHMEAWSEHFQYSSMTTQLFWVFNQAIPVWLACALLFFCEKPKNMIYLWSLVMLTSTFPFVGMLPFVIYYMISRVHWRNDYTKAAQIMRDCWKHWASLQNMLAGFAILLISGLYFMSNDALLGSVSFLKNNALGILLVLAAIILLIGVMLGLFWCVAAIALHWPKVLKYSVCMCGIVFVVMRIGHLAYCDWQTPLFWWLNLTVFYVLEAGVYLICLYPVLKRNKLFWMTSILLYIIPLIIIGSSCDFCMRASIPALLRVMFWCIQVIDQKWGQIRTYLLVGLMVIGAVTPLHEIKRSYSNTRVQYENYVVEPERIYFGGNFSGSTDTLFWKYVAK